MKFLRTSLILTAFFTPVLATAAVTVINNFGAGTQGFAAGLSGPDASIFFSPYDNHEFAFSFQTGGSPAQLTSLKFVVSIGDIFLDSIHGSLSTGSPVAGPVSGLSLGDVAPPSSTPITQTLELVPPSTIVLNPSTTYWVHLTVPAGQAIYSVLNNNVPVFEPGWSLGNSFFRDPVDGWTEITSGPQARIQLNVEPVPEPAATAFITILAAATLTSRRRRGSVG